MEIPSSCGAGITFSGACGAHFSSFFRDRPAAAQSSRRPNRVQRRRPQASKAPGCRTVRPCAADTRGGGAGARPLTPHSNGTTPREPVWSLAGARPTRPGSPGRCLSGAGPATVLRLCRTCHMVLWRDRSSASPNMCADGPGRGD
eukprot:gene17438-biopygen15905